MSIRFSAKEFAKLKELLMIYEWGYRTLMTKLDIIQEDYENFHKNNPIDHIRGRIKAPESIAEKLNRLGLPLTTKKAREFILDIAGIRIICPFARDIYELVELMHNMPDLKILSEKDYVKQPKKSGYRSYHLNIEVPVFHSGRTDYVTIEVQIRTEAMNFWATLEHELQYKYQGDIPLHLSEELTVSADKIAELDHRMFLIHENIMGRSDEITAELLEDKNRKNILKKAEFGREIRRTYRRFRRDSIK